jgi:hypothetical protein
MNLQNHPVSTGEARAGPLKRPGLPGGGRPLTRPAGDPIEPVKPRRRPARREGESWHLAQVRAVLDRFHAEHGWAPGLVWNPWLAEYVAPRRAQERRPAEGGSRHRPPSQGDPGVNGPLTAGRAAP